MVRGRVSPLICFQVSRGDSGGDQLETEESVQKRFVGMGAGGELDQVVEVGTLVVGRMKPSARSPAMGRVSLSVAPVMVRPGDAVTGDDQLERDGGFVTRHDPDHALDSVGAQG